MNLQNEMEIAEKYSNLPYTLKKLQDFTFSEIKFLVGGGGSGPPPPPPPLQALGNLLYYCGFQHQTDLAGIVKGPFQKICPNNFWITMGGKVKGVKQVS